MVALRRTAVGILTAACILGILTLWVVNCSGPRAYASNVRLLSPQTPGGPYRVSVLIHNPSSGHGGVNVTALLRDRKTGVVYAQTQQVVVMLDGGETQAVVLNVDAPRGSYTVQVQLTYPLGSPGAPGPPGG